MGRSESFRTVYICTFTITLAPLQSLAKLAMFYECYSYREIKHIFLKTVCAVIGGGVVS